MSYEAFLAWADEDTHAEWIDGEVIEFMSAKNYHQNMVEFLYALMDLFVRLLGLGKIRLAPFQMRLESSGREPDIMFITTQNLERLTDTHLIGPADLVIEAISDGSVQRDRRDKFREYREAGVREYWIIDPRPGKQRADFYHLSEDGHYDLFATEEDEQVKSVVLDGFWLRPGWLWQLDDLNPFLLFCEMRGLSTEQAQAIEQLLRTGSES